MLKAWFADCKNTIKNLGKNAGVDNQEDTPVLGRTDSLHTIKFKKQKH